MPRRMRPIGVQIAREILKGDMDRAHGLSVGKISWSVSEARAVIGCCKIANAKFFGCSVSLGDFMSRPSN